uniref:NAD(P)-binding domain-containing protein n=1 Tax=Pseudictyota dubia TaxID=2749911 RepID=A0A7R9VCY3_9STRA
MVSMNDFAEIAMSFEDKKLPIKHIEGPMGVRGRNSNNKLIVDKLGWEPTMKIRDGMHKTYNWIKEQVEKEKKEGKDTSAYGHSEVVQQVDDSLMQLGK